MYINCPHCGDRDLREFTPRGHAVGMDRPEGEVWSDAWHDFVHLRDNVAGRNEELWYHGGGCGAWLVVDRSNVTHEVFGTRLARDVAADRLREGRA